MQVSIDNDELEKKVAIALKGINGRISLADLLLANIYRSIGISLLPVQQAVEKLIWLVHLAWKHVSDISLQDMSAFQICLLIWRLPGQKETTEKSWLNMLIHWCSFSMNGFF